MRAFCCSGGCCCGVLPGAATCDPVANAAATDAESTAELAISGAAAAEPAARFGLQATSTPFGLQGIVKVLFCLACARQSCRIHHIQDMLASSHGLAHVAALPITLMMEAPAAMVRARCHPGCRLFLTSWAESGSGETSRSSTASASAQVRGMKPRLPSHMGSSERTLCTTSRLTPSPASLPSTACSTQAAW